MILKKKIKYFSVIRLGDFDTFLHWFCPTDVNWLDDWLSVVIHGDENKEIENQDESRAMTSVKDNWYQFTATPT